MNGILDLNDAFTLSGSSGKAQIKLNSPDERSGNKRSKYWGNGASSKGTYEQNLKFEGLPNLREGALSKQNDREVGTAYQRIHDTRFSLTVRHAELDALRVAPVIGHRSENTANLLNVDRSSTTRADQMNDLSANDAGLDRKARLIIPQEYALRYAKKAEEKDVQFEPKQPIPEANLASQANELAERIRALTDPDEIAKSFAKLDTTLRLEKLKELSSSILQKKFGVDICSELYSNLIGRLTKPEQFEYLKWISEAKGKLSGELNKLGSDSRPIAVENLKELKFGLFSCVVVTHDEISFDDLTPILAALDDEKENGSILMPFLLLANRVSNAREIEQLGAVWEFWNSKDNIGHLKSMTDMLTEKNAENPAFLTPAMLKAVANIVHKIPDPQKDEALKVIVQLACENNKVSEFFSEITELNKDQAWNFAAQELKQNFNTKNAMALTKILVQLPLDRRNSCHTLAGIAFNNNSAGYIFDALQTLRQSDDAAVFDKVDLFALFAEEAEKSGQLSDAGSLLDRLETPQQKIKAFRLSAALMKGNWTEELTNIFKAWRETPGFPALDSTNMQLYNYADLIPSKASYSNASRYAFDEIESIKKDNPQTSELAIKSYYETYKFELSQEESNFLNAVVSLPVVKDQLSSLLAKPSNTQADNDAIDAKRNELTRTTETIEKYHEKRIFTEAFLNKVDPIAHHELMASRLKASFRERVNAQYKNDINYDALKATLIDKFSLGKISQALETQKSFVDKRINLLTGLSPNDQLMGWDVLINDLFAKATGTQDEANIFTHLLAQVSTGSGQSKLEKDKLVLLSNELLRLDKQGLKLPLTLNGTEQLVDALYYQRIPRTEHADQMHSLIQEMTDVSTSKDEDLKETMRIRLKTVKDPYQQMKVFAKAYQTIPDSNSKKRFEWIKAMAAIHLDRFDHPGYRPEYLYLKLENLPVGGISFAQVEPLIKYLRKYELHTDSANLEFNSPIETHRSLVCQLARWINLLEESEVGSNENPRLKARDLVLDQFRIGSSNREWFSKQVVDSSQPL